VFVLSLLLSGNQNFILVHQLVDVRPVVRWNEYAYFLVGSFDMLDILLLNKRSQLPWLGTLWRGVWFKIVDLNSLTWARERTWWKVLGSWFVPTFGASLWAPLGALDVGGLHLCQLSLILTIRAAAKRSCVGGCWVRWGEHRFVLLDPVYVLKRNISVSAILLFYNIEIHFK